MGYRSYLKIFQTEKNLCMEVGYTGLKFIKDLYRTYTDKTTTYMQINELEQEYSLKGILGTATFLEYNDSTYYSYTLCFLKRVTLTKMSSTWEEKNFNKNLEILFNEEFKLEYGEHIITVKEAKENLIKNFEKVKDENIHLFDQILNWPYEDDLLYCNYDELVYLAQHPES